MKGPFLSNPACTYKLHSEAVCQSFRKIAATYSQAMDYHIAIPPPKKATKPTGNCIGRFQKNSDIECIKGHFMYSQKIRGREGKPKYVS